MTDTAAGVIIALAFAAGMVVQGIRLERRMAKAVTRQVRSDLDAMRDRAERELAARVQGRETARET